MSEATQRTPSDTSQQTESDIWAICGYLSLPLAVLAFFATGLGAMQLAQSGNEFQDFLLHRVGPSAFYGSLVLSGLGLFLSRSRAAGTIAALVFIPLFLGWGLLMASRFGWI